GLLARMRGVEDVHLRAVLGETQGEQGARGAAADDGGLHEDARASTAASSSSGPTMEVPSLPTTTPAASLARAAARSSGTPAAAARVRVAITVSPAPVTSKTSRAAVGMCTGRTCGRKSDM